MSIEQYIRVWNRNAAVGLVASWRDHLSVRDLMNAVQIKDGSYQSWTALLSNRLA